MSNQKFKKRVLFVGIPDMAYICLDGLNAAGINIVGVVGPKKSHPTYEAFEIFSKSLGLNFIEFESLTDKEFIDNLKALEADIAVVSSFNYKVPKIMLESTKDGFINVHPSLLPHYRGPNPYSSIILNNEKEAGVTLHFMDENFDTGDIILQKSIPVSEFETMGTLFNRTNLLALDMLFETLQKYENSELERVKQPDGKFKACHPLKEEKELIINFEKSAKEIDSLIRALNPFILARAIFRGTITKILSADTVDENITKNIGEIVQIENDKLYIQTEKGLLAPTAMQFGSFFTGSSKEFIKILGPRVGEKFE